MYNTSTEYKAEIKNASRSFECRVTIGDVILTNDDIVDIVLDGNIQSSDAFSIGNVTSQVLDLTILNKGQTIFTTNQVKVEIGLKIGSSIEYIPMGLYNIDDVVKTDYTIKYTCYDNMIKFETPYFSSLGDTPTLQEVVNELANKTGVQFIGSLPAYTVKKLEGFTCREILSYVASLCGGNAVITRDGKFNIVYPSECVVSLTGDNYFDYKREDVKYKVGKVTCQNSEKSSISQGSIGTDSMELLFENPWVTNSILSNIYTKLNGFEYLGYTMKWQGDISLDVGDILTVTDIKGVIRKLPILSQKFTYTGGLTAEIGAKGESKNKNSFSSNGSISKKVDRIIYDQALINELLANSITVDKLIAKNIKVDVIEGGTANLQTILTSFISGSSGQFLHLTGDNVTFENAIIKDAMIESVSVDKLSAGDISTTMIRLISDSGNMLISDNTIQISDSERPRVQIGKDASNDYNMYVWDSNGNLMFDATGLKADGIKEKVIRDDMIKDDANINGKKINLESLVTELNKDTNTNLIKASKVNIDLDNQTLDLAFSSLKSTATAADTLSKANKTAIGIEQGKINTLISNTTIIKDGATIQLKDAYSTLEQTVDGISTNVATIQTDVDKITNKPIVFNNNIIGGTMTGNTFVKDTDAAVWGDSGFGSSTTFTNGESVEYTVTNLATVVMFGLSIIDTDQSFGTIKYAIYQQNNLLRVYELGTVKYSTAALLVAGDVLKISILNNTIYYYRNDTLLYTSLVPYTTPLILDVAVQSIDGTISVRGNVSLTGMSSRVSTAESKIIQTATDITNKVWSSDINSTLASQSLTLNYAKVVNCTAIGNTVTKNDDGTNAVWDAGFNSVESITNGGYFEFTLTDYAALKMFGVSTSDVNTNYNTIQYGMYPNSATNLTIFESGSNKGIVSTTVAVGDVYRIAVEDNKVCYYQNGKLVYTSLTAPTLPLILDCSLYTTGSKIGNIKKGTMLTGINTRLSSAETKLTDSAFTVQINKNSSKVFRVRYIRDWCSGDSAGFGYNFWAEVKAIDVTGFNVAKGKPVTSNLTLTNGAYATDGELKLDANGNSINVAQTAGSLGYIQIDLGTIYTNLDELRIWHYIKGNGWIAMNGTKTEVSEDNVNWVTVFDSASSGRYDELMAGHTIRLNNNFTHTMTGSFTDEGLKVDAGALMVVDGTDLVFTVKKDSLLNSGIELGSSTRSNKPYIDFHSSGFANDYDARIICVGGGNAANNTADLGISAKNLVITANVSVTGGITATGQLNGVNGQAVCSPAGSIYQLADGTTYLHVGTGHGNYAVAWNLSDMMLKTKFDYTHETALDKIMAIEHAEFNWIDSGKYQKLGVVAQQLELVEPSWVVRVPQPDGEELVQPVVFEILPYITKSIQEQQMVIEELKKRIEVLESAV